jgi:glycosyltransferase involved in cell wall biosynthesis
MNLLIVNFVTDELHGVLAWQAKVIYELAKYCKKIVVVTSQVGKFNIPPNVILFKIPRWPLGIPQRFGGKWLLNWHVFNLCRKYKIDAVFIHMAAGWAYYLNPCFKLLNIPALLWYTHGTVSNMLKRAVHYATRVVTSTPEGCRLSSDKIYIIGHGIDTDLFNLQSIESERRDILSVARISPRKRINLLVDVMRFLVKIPNAPQLKLRLIGPPLTQKDEYYESKLKDKVQELGIQNQVEFVGFVPQNCIPTFYRTAFLHISVSQTGSMDKSVLESLACGCPVLTSNEAFYEMLTDYPDMVIHNENPETIANQILRIYKQRDKYDRLALRKLVISKHDIHSYAKKIMKNLEEIIMNH